MYLQICNTVFDASLIQPTTTPRDRGGTVVKVLCYKSEGRWFDSRRFHRNFLLT